MGYRASWEKSVFLFRLNSALLNRGFQIMNRSRKAQVAIERMGWKYAFYDLGVPGNLEI